MKSTHRDVSHERYQCIHHPSLIILKYGMTARDKVDGQILEIRLESGDDAIGDDHLIRLAEQELERKYTRLSGCEEFGWVLRAFGNESTNSRGLNDCLTEICRREAKGDRIREKGINECNSSVEGLSHVVVFIELRQSVQEQGTSDVWNDACTDPWTSI